MAKNAFDKFLEEVRSSVMFTIADYQAHPENYSDWSEAGDKGIAFSFYNGETFTLPEASKIRIWGREEKIGKKKYPILYTALKCSIQGWMEVPISIFRRIPSLKEELALLKVDNGIGVQLIPRMPDIKRMEKLISIVGDKSVVVNECLLHKDDFDQDKNKPIKDDASLEEKDRVPLMCYKFNFK